MIDLEYISANHRPSGITTPSLPPKSGFRELIVRESRWKGFQPYTTLGRAGLGYHRNSVQGLFLIANCLLVLLFHASPDTFFDGYEMVAVTDSRRPHPLRGGRPAGSTPTGVWYSNSPEQTIAEKRAGIGLLLSPTL